MVDIKFISKKEMADRYPKGSKEALPSGITVYESIDNPTICYF